MVTVVKHTYRKNEGRGGNPVWREESDEVTLALEVIDQMDSVSIGLTAESQGLRVPTVRSSSDIRISYTDLEKLVMHLIGILARHKDDVEKELAAADEALLTAARAD